MTCPTLGHLMMDAVRAHPDRPAVIELLPASTEIGRQMSYAELDHALDAVAAGAHASGLVAGDRVLVSLHNRLEMVTVPFGLMRAGIVPVILNPRLACEDFDWLARDSDARAVYADAAAIGVMGAAPILGELPLRVAIGEAQEGWSSFETICKPGGDYPLFEAETDDLAMIMFTSGSTGRPKGVLLPHQGQIENFLGQRAFYSRIYTRPSVNLIAAPMFHKNGTGNVKTAFVMAGTVVIMPRFDPEALLKAIPQHGVTTFTAVATMLMMMMKHPQLIDGADFSSLDSIMVGAAPAGRVLLDEIERRFGTRTFHMYGTTEGGATLGHDPEQHYTLDSCGRPLPGVEVQLVAPDGSINEKEGELWVRSHAVAMGYHNRDSVTAERFRTGGWYATGDVLSRDEQGYFFFRGRTDDMFVCGGENVYPMEVERLLLIHPGVANACVAPVTHPTKGQAPAAAVVLRDPTVDEAALKAWCLERGPAYAHPRFIAFVNEFPVAPTGKVDRSAVQTMLAAIAKTRLQDA